MQLACGDKHTPALTRTVLGLNSFGLNSYGPVNSSVLFVRVTRVCACVRACCVCCCVCENLCACLLHIVNSYYPTIAHIKQSTILLFVSLSTPSKWWVCIYLADGPMNPEQYTYTHMYTNIQITVDAQHASYLCYVRACICVCECIWVRSFVGP